MKAKKVVEGEDDFLLIFWTIIIKGTSYYIKQNWLVLFYLLSMYSNELKPKQMSTLAVPGELSVHYVSSFNIILAWPNRT